MSALKIFTAAIIMISGTAAASTPADTLRLTLRDCIRMAQEQGPLGAIAQHKYEAKKSRYASFRAGFYPQLSLQGDVPGYYSAINPIVLPDGTTVFTPQREASSSVNLGLTQKIPFTGGQLSLQSGLNRIDLMDQKSYYYRATPLSVSLTQPLFQINTMAWDQDAQDLTWQMASREEVEAMEDCAIDATNKYFGYYLASMNAANAAFNVAINDTLYRISQGRFNVGRIAENDLLQSELAYLDAKTQSENANVELARAEQTLRVAVGVSSGTPIGLLPPGDIGRVEVDPDQALVRAKEHRSDVLNFDLQLLNAERSVRQAKSDNGFNATMTARVGYNQRAPEIRDAYSNLLQQEQFSVGFAIPLFRWGAGSEAVDAAVAEQKSTEVTVGQQRQTFDQEVLYAANRLNTLRKQVANAAKSDTIGQRRFEVAKQRYIIGKIDIPILFIAQSEKDNARRSNVQTQWDYWSTYYRVRRLTLYDFENGRALVDVKE
jgi:outer membrane protein TolC